MLSDENITQIIMIVTVQVNIDFKTVLLHRLQSYKQY